MGEGPDGFAFFHKGVDQVVEPETGVVGDIVQGSFVQGIYAHAHVQVIGGFFHEGLGGMVGAGLDDAVVHLDLLGVGGDGHDGVVVFVFPEQLLETEVGEQVAVHDQEIVGQVHDELDGRGRAQGLLLVGVFDSDAELGAVAKIGLDQVGHVVDADGGFPDTLPSQVLEEDLQDGFFSYRDQGFGQTDGVWFESDAFSAGQDYGSHAGFTSLLSCCWAYRGSCCCAKLPAVPKIWGQSRKLLSLTLSPSY